MIPAYQYGTWRQFPPNLKKNPAKSKKKSAPIIIFCGGRSRRIYDLVSSNKRF
jgi:hypothetical protein